RQLVKHVFAAWTQISDSLKCPRPQRRKERVGRDVFPVPRFLSSSGVKGRPFVTWDDGSMRPVALSALGQRYRRYRLVDPLAEEAMAGSLRRWGQLSPLVACADGQQLEVLDGFKRLVAAQQVAGWATLSVRVIEVDERTAKAAILGLNRGQRPVRELEE